MNALILCYETPVPPHGGSQLRVLNLARQLTTVGEVTVAALGDVPDVVDEPFRLVGVPHSFSRRRALIRSWRRPYLDALLGSNRFPAVVADGSWDVVIVTSPFFVDAARGAGAPVILDAHNVDTDIMATLATTDDRLLHRLRWRWEAAKMAKAESAGVRSVDAVLACSEADADVFRGWDATRVVVVPNGVDTASVPWQPPAIGARLLYLAQFGYLPNEVAALELVREVLPAVRAEVPSARVDLVGRNAGERLQALASDHVAVLGEVPEVLPHLHGASVMVVPLRAGSGTRLKILEAMAAGTPVVATPLGAAGLDAADGRDLLLGETPAELAAQVVRVLDDPDLALRLSTRARALVEERYDWSSFTPTMVTLLDDLAGERAT